MKHFLITLAITAASIFNKSHAADGTIPSKALTAFRSTYTHTTDVKWTMVDNYYQVSFLLSGRLALALYTADGAPIAVTKKVSPLELPAKLRVNLKKELKQRWVSDLFVVTSDQGDEYYVTMENADTKVVLKSYYGKKWRFYQHSAK